jgi:histidinol-phosphate aminotransferase
MPTPPRSSLPEPNPSVAEIERLPEGGGERNRYIGLDRNERTTPLPAEVLDAIRAEVDSALLTRYPSLEPLYADLSKLLEVPRQRLLLTAGSDAAFRALHQAYIRPGDRVVMLDPSYAMYPIYTRMFGAEPVQVPFSDDLTLDPDALLGAIDRGVRMVLLADPNQPTGTALSRELLLSLLERAGEHGVLVVIDEAYFPFSDATVLPWIKEHRHLVVTRTFSKAWGLAGLRVGLVASDPEVVANLYRVRSAYDVGAVAAVCVRTLLAHPEVADEFVTEVDAGRRVLAERARALGLEPLAGRTNFELLRCAGRIETALLGARRRDLG